jgi:5-(carboxyamino)imidazole ribonucleotide mutase
MGSLETGKKSPALSAAGHRSSLLPLARRATCMVDSQTGRAWCSFRVEVRERMAEKTHATPLVGIVMGSDSDLPTMRAAAEVCAQFGVSHEVRIVSAHRTPDDMAEYGRTAHTRGLRVIIAGAGGAAHLPGMLAAHTPLPVIGVPVLTEALRGLDSLLSIVQMPAGVPVATVAIGNARNAGLLAVRILAACDPALQRRMLDYQAEIAAQSREKNRALGESSSFGQ